MGKLKIHGKARTLNKKMVEGTFTHKFFMAAFQLLEKGWAFLVKSHLANRNLVNMELLVIIIWTA
jgi:hypothetical protein